MDLFKEYLDKMSNLVQRLRVEEIFNYIDNEFPQLEKRISWNQPMYTDHGTFILGLSVAKNHISIAPEKKALEKFSNKIKESGYEQSLELIKIKLGDPINFSLLSEIVSFNIEDKKECKTFWRK